MSNHQDWNEVVFKKRSTTSKAKPQQLEKQKLTSGGVTAVKKYAAGSNQQRSAGDVRKIADAEDAQPLPTVGLDLRKAIAQARQEKGWTQKQLATAINEKQTVVQAYEAGKAIPSNQVLAKMERKLGVSLRGKEFKKKG
eukprot:CAMPEP_0168600366 /NCGR_PEP_ID=MMETSP0420-20121227/12730_1 /TAXON_ID=498008 /ORGANISM="Pessonella sp." /LENGTH=138 /DNA_ID=CAMNT_0008638421 /DNA_START=8 /DNA_END=420 /DNA_ORIENTATION=-